jgi:hypothetical protein
MAGDDASGEDDATAVAHSSEADKLSMARNVSWMAGERGA